MFNDSFQFEILPNDQKVGQFFSIKIIVTNQSYLYL